MSCTTATNLRGPRRRAAALPYMVAVTFGLAAANNNAAPVINANPANCGALASLTVPNTTFTSATYISPTAKTPGYCDLKATVAPQTDIEIWLPDQWFQRYLHLGGGGFDGAIPNLSAPPAAFNVNPVSSGYVVAGSNGGNRGSSYPGA